MRVFVKDDDPLSARTLERQLLTLGHAVERIDDVSALLEGRPGPKPDVIITDIFMPDIEGLDFIRRLKRSNLSGVPIIAISGGGTYMGGIPNVGGSFVAKAAVDFGAVMFLPKPVKISDLQAAILACAN